MRNVQSKSSEKSTPATLTAAGSDPIAKALAEVPAGLAKEIDRWLHAQIARFTKGISPMALVGAYLDWATHLAASPGCGSAWNKAPVFGVIGVQTGL